MHVRLVWLDSMHELTAASVGVSDNVRDRSVEGCFRVVETREMPRPSAHKLSSIEQRLWLFTKQLEA
jgi:hypothetical protein